MSKRSCVKPGPSCDLCPFDRYIEICHIVPKRLGGADAPWNVSSLCPNHHKLLDWGLLNESERTAFAPRLMRLCEIYHDDMRVIDYLYFQLGLKELPPRWMQHKRRLLLDKIAHRQSTG